MIHYDSEFMVIIDQLWINTMIADLGTGNQQTLIARQAGS